MAIYVIMCNGRVTVLILKQLESLKGMGDNCIIIVFEQKQKSIE